MHRTLTLLFKFKLNTKDGDIKHSGGLDNIAFLTHVFDTLCKLEHLTPAIRVHKQDLIDLGREMSKILNTDVVKDEVAASDPEFLLYLPVHVQLDNSLMLKNGLVKNPVKSNLNSNLIERNDELEWMEMIKAAIHDKIIEKGKTWNTIAEDLCVCLKKLRKDLKKISGLSLIAFQNKVQLELACEMLLNRSDLTINQISKAVGFRDTKYFSKKFKTHYGLVPSVYRGKFKNSKDIFFN